MVWKSVCFVKRPSASLVLGLVAAVGLIAPHAARAENASLAAATHSITAGELQKHVEVLADDSLEGREAGSRGGRAAAIYLRREMVRYGIEPLSPGGDFFQLFQGRYKNILGKIEGADPELKNEIILVSAHYDHVGYGRNGNSFGPFGHIHNGADDNASGTSALLELMEACSNLSTPLRRTVAFAFWDGEEMGLLGSKHFARYPAVPLRQIKLLINMDMVGRLRKETLSVYGSRTVPGSRRMLSQLNRDSDLLLDFNWEVKENSDHWPFYQKGVPYLMFHTGLHDDYHRPRDDADKINSDGMQRIARLLLATVHAMANQETLPAFRSYARSESPAALRRLEQAPPAPAGRFGVAWRAADDASEGLRLTRVVPNSSAAKAGLRVGDRLLTFDNRLMRTDEDLRAAVGVATNPVPVMFVREGEEGPQERIVELGGRPQRLGVAWRSDDAEPGTVLVTRVLRSSSAFRAGLRAKDRICQINGEPFRDSDDLLQRAKALPLPFTLLVERQGRMQTVTLRDLARPPH